MGNAFGFWGWLTESCRVSESEAEVERLLISCKAHGSGARFWVDLLYRPFPPDLGGNLRCPEVSRYSHLEDGTRLADICEYFLLSCVGL